MKMANLHSLVLKEGRYRKRDKVYFSDYTFNHFGFVLSVRVFISFPFSSCGIRGTFWGVGVGKREMIRLGALDDGGIFFEGWII